MPRCSKRSLIPLYWLPDHVTVAWNGGWVGPGYFIDAPTESQPTIFVDVFNSFERNQCVVYCRLYGRELFGTSQKLSYGELGFDPTLFTELWLGEGFLSPETLRQGAELVGLRNGKELHRLMIKPRELILDSLDGIR